jgi:glucokinase
MTTLNYHARLVADIGGTNARFAMLDATGRPDRISVLPCANYPDIVSAAEDYLAHTGGERPSVAAIAIATPITGDRITMTNHHWSFSVREITAQLGLQHLSVLNDFEALALSLPALLPNECFQIGGGTATPGAPIGVLGPGTGLGAAGLIPSGKSWLALPGEGGHVTLAAADDFESEIIAVLRSRFGHVSAERVLSGPGLVTLYEILCTLRKKAAETLSPAEVTKRALDGSDPLCHESLTTFCAMLGTVASNLALTLGTRGGIYLGGGILPQLGTFFENSPFRSRFENKGRFSTYLATIPCYVILSEYPALLGAARALDKP